MSSCIWTATTKVQTTLPPTCAHASAVSLTRTSMRHPSGVYVLTEKIKVDKHRVHVAKVKDGAEPSEIGYIVKLDKRTGTRK